ncbi:hypothetical protein KYK30_30090 [Shinella yambaruensis]|uniref:Uncharacterized protein n=1 Tax=Shinella yambaruensis TaxID=415996 RepID=A0ABQ5ZG96_9HYPH|nr:hypothetical protein [Shinella yambaruensis]MCJ8028723.1 hypothetical protein [Shinella yambaruensis]MCU7983972.1 hypothetical protein [Shinella yambaruensis]GLR49908.1 hypothetical protein GCM10007923_11130 [Shinella yambaruensis]
MNAKTTIHSGARKVSKPDEVQVAASLAVLAKVHTEARADVSPDLLNAIREHEAANAAWLATSDEDLPTGTMEEKAADQAEKKLIHFPCHSHADVLAKVGYLYQQDTEAARAAHDTVQAGYLDELLGSLIGIEALGGCAATGRTVATASPTIPEMYEEWLAVRNAPWDRTDEEMDEGLSRYQILQARIIAAEPQTPRDVAIMFIVDSDYMESDHSEEFESRVREIAVGSTADDAAPPAETIETLFGEWMFVSQSMSGGDTPYIHEEKLKQYGSLRERITGMRPATVRELAIILYVETTAGCSDCSDDFMTHVFALAGLENNNVSQDAARRPSVGGLDVEAMPAPVCRPAPRATIEIDDIQTATGCLHALLESVYEVSTEIQYQLPDGSRDRSAERLNSLIILARDEAERMDQQVEAYIDSEKAKEAGQ